MSTRRISKKDIYFCDKEARRALEPLFRAVTKAQAAGKPGMVIAQVRKDSTGDGVFMDVHFLPHEQGVNLNAFIVEVLLKEEEAVR